MRMLIGDKVMWRGSFGNDAPKEAKITSIELCQVGEKYGMAVPNALWSQKDRIVVDLDNGHWARGSQLSPMK